MICVPSVPIRGSILRLCVEAVVPTACRLLHSTVNLRHLRILSLPIMGGVIPNAATRPHRRVETPRPS
jgi:hypothetical protein